MKRFISVLVLLCILLCSCGNVGKDGTITVDKGGKYSFDDAENILVNTGAVTLENSTVSNITISDSLMQKDSVYIYGSTGEVCSVYSPCTVSFSQSSNFKKVSVLSDKGAKVISDTESVINELDISSLVKDITVSGRYIKVVVESNSAFITISSASIDEIVVNGEYNSLEIKGQSSVKKLVLNGKNNGYKADGSSEIKEVIDNSKSGETETPQISKEDIITPRQKICNEAKSLAKSGDHTLSKVGMTNYFLKAGYSANDVNNGIADAGISWTAQAQQYVLDYLSAGQNITPNEMKGKLELLKYNASEISNAISNVNANDLWCKVAVYYAKQASGNTMNTVIDQLRVLGFTTEQGKYGAKYCGRTLIVE